MHFRLEPRNCEPSVGDVETTPVAGDCRGHTPSARNGTQGLFLAPLKSTAMHTNSGCSAPHPPVPPGRNAIISTHVAGLRIFLLKIMRDSEAPREDTWQITAVVLLVAVGQSLVTSSALVFICFPCVGAIKRSKSKIL